MGEAMCPLCEQEAESHCDRCPIVVCRGCGVQGRPMVGNPEVWSWVRLAELARW